MLGKRVSVALMNWLFALSLKLTCRNCAICRPSSSAHGNSYTATHTHPVHFPCSML